MRFASRENTDWANPKSGWDCIGAAVRNASHIWSVGSGVEIVLGANDLTAIPQNDMDT